MNTAPPSSRRPGRTSVRTEIQLHHAAPSAVDTYEVNPATGALTLTEEFNDPIVGKILLHSVYRRG